MNIKNILFIYISKNFCNIGIFYENKIIMCKKYSYKNHLNLILKLIENLLKNNKISIKKFNIISCINEPDFETSTRICLSISKGLSIGLNIPIIKISLFEIISEKIFNLFNIKNNILITIKNYSNFLSWSTSYKNKSDKWIIKNRNLSNIEKIINFLNKKKGNWIFNGVNINNIYKKKFNNLNIKFINFISFNMKDVIYNILRKNN